MKSFTYAALLGTLITQATAHYVFPAIEGTEDWQYVRMFTDQHTNGPVTSVETEDIRCNKDGVNGGSTQTLDVAAGSEVAFTVRSEIGHPGPLQFYMAKVPEGASAVDWDGAGDVWFKIYGDGPNISPEGLTWPSSSATTVSVTLPSSLPSGEYLLRVEHTALHGASEAGGAQFYISCAQINVTGGGNGSPGPLVAFPGAYSPTDPGLMINIYYPVPTEYILPGPEVWTG
ncbi:hypothetical protein AJ79_09868 [Helicocarpus griseus UAMH5409]|uniref:lytic cellulose monooxygenase (C4-dehydrogenating) n=1 Tax=Helicocarpus griseus UAMH5409 TaxID=1447875 RepID=A0A2B7WGS9_9EURO|nr:hypothetical protein AJ79_09868 [Helicocarpus griseus UAMH5409]